MPKHTALLIASAISSLLVLVGLGVYGLYRSGTFLKSGEVTLQGVIEEAESSQSSGMIGGPAPHVWKFRTSGGIVLDLYTVVWNPSLGPSGDQSAQQYRDRLKGFAITDDITGRSVSIHGYLNAQDRSLLVTKAGQYIQKL